MSEQEQIESLEVMEVLTGIKMFIPGTYIYRRMRVSGGSCPVRFKVVSRTAKTVTLSQVPARDGYGWVEKYAEPFRVRVATNYFLKSEISRQHKLIASKRC